MWKEHCKRVGRDADAKSVKRPAKKNVVLIFCNVSLVLIMILILVVYSRTVLYQKNTMKRDAFCTMVESMKQVSENYLYTEKGYVDDWAAYISSEHMTAEEALDYIRTTNTHKDRMAHLVDMDDMSARSTMKKNGVEWVHCYDDMLKSNMDYAETFLDKLRSMFEADSDSVLVLGKYRVGEAQQTVISVGTRVTIREEDGTNKDYLLLRLIPVEYLQKSWVFATEFPTAEISLINNDGGYIVQSPSLRSKNFLEFIRGYNFQDDYNKMNELEEQLNATQSGLLEYKNSASKNCYFNYSSLGLDSNVFILGYIPVEEVQSDITDWSIVILICGTLLLLVVIDGRHILSVNKQLRKAVAMAEKANLAKTQFLSSMSHDIRTPMNAVIGMTEIAKRHLDDPAYVGDCLDKVSMSGNHLLTLINDILDISKVESGKMTLNPCTFSLQNIVEEMSAMIRQNANAKKLAFTLNMHDISCDAIVGDPLRIRQILINLLSNAVKYTEPGGHVTFDVSEYKVQDTEEKIGLKFVVADDGIGMSEEFQKGMYSSFSRATDSRINFIQGSGLGLAIANQMVELMQGSIDCVSTLEKGTTFTVKLTVPVAEEKIEPSEASEPLLDSQAGEFAGMQVLVAEDNDLNWIIIETLLEEYGVKADRAENGQVCLERLNDANAPRYAMIFMDVQMPVMNGREATDCLRHSENPYVRNIPVVAMTADAFAEDVYACIQAGMDDHISKPVDMKHVLRVLRSAKAGTLHK